MNSSYLQYITDDVEAYMWSKSEEFLCSQEDTALDSRFDVGAGRERIKTRLRRWWLFLYCCRIIGRLCTPTAIVWGDSGSPFRVRPLVWSDGTERYVHERMVGTPQVRWQGKNGRQKMRRKTRAVALAEKCHFATCFPSLLKQSGGFMIRGTVVRQSRGSSGSSFERGTCQYVPSGIWKWLRCRFRPHLMLPAEVFVIEQGMANIKWSV